MHNQTYWKSTAKICQVCLSIGCVVGIFGALYTVIAQKYLFFNFYLLIAYVFRDWINNGMLVGFLVWLILICIFAVVHYSLKLIPTSIKPKKILNTGLVCGALCVYGIYNIHHFWGYFAPSKYHVKTFMYDFCIIIFLGVLGWGSVKLNWEYLLEKSANIFRRTAVVAIAILAMFNIALAFHDALLVDKKADVILISIDALRADHLGCYGYKRATSPTIDAFANNNVLFERAFAHQPWTLPSHMSMLTGLYARTHGVGAEMDTTLPPSFLSLPEILKNAGYATMGFVSGGIWMHSFYGFNDGFDYYHLAEFYNPGMPERNAEYQNLFIKRYLKKNKKKNNFIFIHYFDVHSDAIRLPYDAPIPYDKYFTGNYTGTFNGSSGEAVASKYLASLNEKKIFLPKDQLDYVIALYDNGIAYMDKCIGDLFAILKDAGIYEDALIIVTADHGEAFQEHGYFIHGTPYYHDEQIHVPLIIKLPPKAPPPKQTKIHGMVELIDIMPSILDVLGIEAFPLDGISFIPLINNVGEEKEYVYGLGSLKSIFVRTKEWALLSDDELNETHFQLFNLVNDPGQKNNLVQARPDIKNALKNKLQSRIEMSRSLRFQILGGGIYANTLAKKKVNLNDDQKDRLKSLGYLQ